MTEAGTVLERVAPFKGNPTQRVTINGVYVGRIVKVGNKFQARKRTTRGPGAPLGLFPRRRDAIDALA